MRDGRDTGMYTGALVGRAPIGEPSAAADSARRVNIKDRETTLLVFEVGANKQSAIRHMSRRELLEEARRASTPLRLQRADGPAARLGADAVLKARDVRKVDPLFAGRLEPVILVRCGSITVSLGRTELRAIILHDRLYFIVPDGADSMLQEVHRNLLLVLHGSLAGDSGGAARSEPPSTEHSPHPARHDGGPIAPARAAGTPPPYAPPPLSSVATGGFGADSGAPPPFEFAALEAVLMIACSDLHKRQEELGSLVRCALLELRRTVVGSRVVAGSKQLEAVRELKQEVRELSLTAQALDRAIDACLDDDEDMARMYLSRLHSAARGVAPAPPQTALRRRATEETLAKFSSTPPVQTPPPHTPLPAGSLGQVGRSASLLSGGGAEGDEEDLEEHEEVEMLLESYAQEVGSTLGALEAIAYSIESTEKFVSFRLDSARNRLLKVDVLAGILAAMFGCCSFIAGVFGMNFKTPLFEEDEPLGLGEGTLFNLVAGLTLGLLLVWCVGTYCFFSTHRCWRPGKLRRDQYLERNVIVT